MTGRHEFARLPVMRPVTWQTSPAQSTNAFSAALRTKLVVASNLARAAENCSRKGLAGVCEIALSACLLAVFGLRQLDGRLVPPRLPLDVRAYARP